MAGSNVIIVHLRQPRRSNPSEMRSDPFWEFGSFGCTRCHCRNLMNPKKIHELEGARLAFAQGGALGFRLVFLSPPVSVVKHARCCEAKWEPVSMPFKYATAPLLVDNDGESDFPAMLPMLASGKRETMMGQFSSQFRSCRTALKPIVARSLIRGYERALKRAWKEDLAQTYDESLPYKPSKLDRERLKTYTAALRKAQGVARNRSRCG